MNSKVMITFYSSGVRKHLVDNLLSYYTIISLVVHVLVARPMRVVLALKAPLNSGEPQPVSRCFLIIE